MKRRGFLKVLGMLPFGGSLLPKVEETVAASAPNLFLQSGQFSSILQSSSQFTMTNSNNQICWDGTSHPWTEGECFLEHPYW